MQHRSIRSRHTAPRAVPRLVAMAAATAVVALAMAGGTPGAQAQEDAGGHRSLAAPLDRTAAGEPTRGPEVRLPPGADPAAAERAGRIPARLVHQGQPPALFRGRALNCQVPSFGAARFAGFDSAVNAMLGDWDIGSAALAVSNECATIYQRGYGSTGPWSLRNATANSPNAQGVATPANALYEIASITKPITAAAIHDLSERGRLNKDDRAFCVPGGPTNCILTVDLPANFDRRIGNITVRHLVSHRGGFDRSQTTDYLFRAWEVYQARDLSAPPTPRDFAEHMLGLGLDFAPNARSAYSNLGYLILGMVIERVSGQSYRDYVHQRLLAPLGIAARDVVLSRSKRMQRDPREPAYSCIDNTWGGVVPRSTFPGEVGQRRCWADGGFVLESMAAHGGLSMTASAVATFYAHWWNFGTPREDDYLAFPDPNAVAYSHNGLLAATSTVAARCTNGLNVVLLTNQHAWGTFDFGEVEERLCGAADAFLAQGPYYATTWVKDGASPWVSHRQTRSTAYQARFDQLRQAGYRLLDVNGYRSEGATWYAHTWLKNTAGTGWAATHGQTFAAFTTRFEQLSDAGYRLERVSGWNEGGTPRYASTWVANPAGTAWLSHIRMTSAQYQQRFDEYGARGFRLLSVDGYEWNGQPYYAAVWLRDATPTRAVHGVGGAAYQAFFDQAVAAGYRLVDQDVFTVGNSVRFAGVFTRAAGPAFRAHATWNFYTYEPNWAKLTAQGWRPVSIAGYR